MSMIARPGKEGGFFRYVDKVAAGFKKILASEADLDLDTIYGDYNGNIRDANIAGDAAIAGSKLNLGAPGTVIPPSAIPPGTNIPGGAIAPGTITTTEIQNNTIIADDLADGAVTLPKMYPGAGIRHAQPSAVIAPFTHLSPIETPPKATVGTGLTFGGSAVLLFLTWRVVVDWTRESHVIVRCYRTTAPSTVEVLKVQDYIAAKITDVGTSATRTILPNITFTDALHPGLHEYYITVQCLDAGYGTSTVYCEGGDMGLVEIA